LPEIGVGAVAGNAGAVPEQLADGDVVETRVGVAAQPVEVMGGRSVEVELLPLGKLHNGGGGEHFGLGADVEEVARSERFAGFGIGQAVGARKHDVAVVPDSHGKAGKTAGASLIPQPGIKEGNGVLEASLVHGEAQMIGQ
jgi:hypothetical protein